MPTDENDDWKEWSVEVVRQVDRDAFGELKRENASLKAERDKLVAENEKREADRWQRWEEKKSRTSKLWFGATLSGVAFVCMALATRLWGLGWSFGGGAALAVLLAFASDWFRSVGYLLRMVSISIVVGAVGFPLAVVLLEQASCSAFGLIRWATHGVPAVCTLDWQ